jgi:hypothetical protein
MYLLVKRNKFKEIQIPKITVKMISINYVFPIRRHQRIKNI